MGPLLAVNKLLTIVHASTNTAVKYENSTKSQLEVIIID